MSRSRAQVARAANCARARSIRVHRGSALRIARFKAATTARGLEAARPRDYPPVPREWLGGLALGAACVRVGHSRQSGNRAGLGAFTRDSWRVRTATSCRLEPHAS